MIPEVRTERLLLRGWTDEDRVPFAVLNADPDVARFLGGPMSAAQSNALVDRIISAWERYGFGPWAVVPDDVGVCVGFVGLWVPSFEAAFTPCVEVGWRLSKETWGRGYAPEAARAALAFGFDDHQLDEIVSLTARDNEKSRRVMEKVGMQHDPTDDFDHPNLQPGDPLRPHVLYRITANRWRAIAT